MISTPDDHISWRPIVALIVLEAAIIICWLAYNEYQPLLFSQFGLDGYAFPFSLAQGLILVATPPLAGLLADRMRQKSGERFLIIQLGVVLVSAVFLAVASLIFSEPGTTTGKWAFAGMILLWLLFMNVFRSPAISLVEDYVPQRQLVQVMAYMVLVFDMVYAMEPSIVPLLQWLGATATFSIGGALILLSGLYLLKVGRSTPRRTGKEFYNDTKDGSSSLGAVLAIGLILGLFLGLMFKVFPALLESRLPFIQRNGLRGEYLVSMAMGISAIWAILLSDRIRRGEVLKVNQQGAFASAVLIAVMILANNQYIMVTALTLLTLSLAAYSVTALPLVFYKLGSHRTVLGLGIYYSGLELTNSIIEIIQAS